MRSFLPPSLGSSQSGHLIYAIVTKVCETPVWSKYTYVVKRAFYQDRLGTKKMERKSWDNRAGVLCVIGNMVLVETDRGQQFANIDFGWVEEGPSVDTGRFPIPTGLRYLLDATSQKAEFYDLCWDANRVLYRHRAELKEQWCAMLVQRGAGNAFFWRDDAIVY